MMELLKEVKKKNVLQCICMKKESIVYQSNNVYVLQCSAKGKTRIETPN